MLQTAVGLKHLPRQGKSFCSRSIVPQLLYFSGGRQGDPWQFWVDGDKFYSFRRMPLLEMSLPLAFSRASTALGQFAACFSVPFLPAHTCAPSYSIVPQGQHQPEVCGMMMQSSGWTLQPRETFVCLSPAATSWLPPAVLALLSRGDHLWAEGLISAQSVAFPRGGPDPSELVIVVFCRGQRLRIALG